MATYLHGNSEIQGGSDGLQTMLLMNPGYVGYSDNQPSALHLPHAPPSQLQHFVGIPLQNATPAASTQDPNHHDAAASAFHGFLPRLQYNLYNQPMDLAPARELTLSQHQGLSLSLSSQQPGYVPAQQLTAAAMSQNAVGASPSPASNGMNAGVQSVLFSSKYLKASQELLDEVVKVDKVAKITADGQSNKTGAHSTPMEAAVGGGEGSEKRGAELTTADKQQIQMKITKLISMLDEVEQRYRQYHQQMQMIISWFEQLTGIGSAKTYTALALQTISKQFRCLKDAILAQIQGASKSLGEENSLGGWIECSRLNQIRQQKALQQLGMIQHNAWRPQRGLPERSVSVLRAWLFEHFLHPYPKDSDKIILAKQTGLTRSQVSNWFINARVRLWKPMVEEMYMEEVKEQDKNGSEDKSRKSEQNKDSTSKSSTPLAKNPVIVNQSSSSIPKQNNTISTSATASVSMSMPLTSPTGVKNNIVGFHLIGSSELGSIAQGSPKKPRNADMPHSPRVIPSMKMDSSKPSIPDNKDMPSKFGYERQNRDGFTLLGAPTNFIGGFGSYPMGELGRFGEDSFQAPYSGNGFSLTLGLPHCENLPIAPANHTFLSNQGIQIDRGLGIGDTDYFGSMNNTPTSNHPNIVYESINIQNPTGSLLPDVMT